jgi:hypothetical protein
MPTSTTRADDTEIGAAWLSLADGLHVQRLYLCLPDLARALTEDPARLDLGNVGSVDALLARCEAPHEAVRELLAPAGLLPYVDLCIQHGTAATPWPTAYRDAADTADALVAGLPLSETIVRAVEVLSHAAAWWVCFFAVVRSSGVHHITLQSGQQPIDPARLAQAAQFVAVGLATRALQTHLRFGPADAVTARTAYCRAISCSVQVEQDISELLDAVSDLRIVDLVSTVLPWRGRLIKYAGGTGAGQVE